MLPLTPTNSRENRMKVDPIITDRLIIRGFRPADVGFAMSVWNDPEMGEYLADPSLTNMDAEYRKSLESLGDDAECCYLISESKATGERIGTCSFIPSADASVYDIAYCVHKTYWRQGYATEMAIAMIHYARQHGATTITIDINKENAASNAIARKLGFSVVGEKTYQKRGTDNTFTDLRYALTLVP